MFEWREVKSLSLLRQMNLTIWGSELDMKELKMMIEVMKEGRQRLSVTTSSVYLGEMKSWHVFRQQKMWLGNSEGWLRVIISFTDKVQH